MVKPAQNLNPQSSLRLLCRNAVEFQFFGLKLVRVGPVVTGEAFHPSWSTVRWLEPRSLTWIQTLRSLSWIQTPRSLRPWSWFPNRIFNKFSICFVISGQDTNSNLFSVGFSQSWINENGVCFYKRKIKVLVNCFSQCSETSWVELRCPCIFKVPEATHQGR